MIAHVQVHRSPTFADSTHSIAHVAFHFRFHLRVWRLACADQHPTTSCPCNSENTELYAVFPYRLYGLQRCFSPAGRAPVAFAGANDSGADDRGNLTTSSSSSGSGRGGTRELSSSRLSIGCDRNASEALANLTYERRQHPSNTGWGQDLVQAAILGRAAECESLAVARLTQHRAPGWWYPGFLGPGPNTIPDGDHIAVFKTGLQAMLLQAAGDKILLFPAWPSWSWDVIFTLRAPGNTTVRASCRNGLLDTLVVTPASRTSDIIHGTCQPQLGS